ncbi:hypothetical protein [Sphingobium chungbukense]|nr:hypothetical protein [Sphingobium chungbukense]
MRLKLKPSKLALRSSITAFAQLLLGAAALIAALSGRKPPEE